MAACARRVHEHDAEAELAAFAGHPFCGVGRHEAALLAKAVGGGVLPCRLDGALDALDAHDLGVARLLANRLLVMKQGQVVESGLTDRVLDDPHHPYTQLLVSSVLQN